AMATEKTSTEPANKESADSAPASSGSSHAGVPAFMKALLILLLAGALAFGLFTYFNRPVQESDLLEASGRVEGYETNIGAKIGGRVDEINHREGEAVVKGELIAQISDDDIQAQLRGTEAMIEKAKMQVESAKDRKLVLQSQIDECLLKVAQSKEDSVGKIREWESKVAMAESRLSESKSNLIKTEADLNLAKTRKERYEFLISKEAVTRDEYDQVVNTFETEKALVDSAKANLSAVAKELYSSKGQLDQARSSRLSPHIQSAEKISLERQLEQADHDLKSAENQVAAAIADRDQIKANVAYLKILCPIDGIVTARAMEPGAVVTPGQTILSVIDLNKVYLRAYIPEAQIGKVRVGQSCEVYLDANPKKPLSGKVIQVDPQASFTPENIYFKDDRIKQVFGVKIGIDNPAGFAKPGMPADARIRLN
ncbi:MAG: efflux RND transporter periplasmic adaptor subunit, partial [Candidatus Obscuribacterales bacterium]|nr:efflux RND transporter periplasmic adaptor subunit [Candidatus Obscuribacterales bacterium]